MARQTPPELLDWLDKQLDAKGWTDHRLSKVAGFGNSVMPKIRAGTGPGFVVCIAIAKTFRVPPESVLRLAGHLPHPPAWSPDLDEWAGLYGQLTEDDRAELIAVARLKALRRRKGK